MNLMQKSALNSASGEQNEPEVELVSDDGKVEVNLYKIFNNQLILIKKLNKMSKNKTKLFDIVPIMIYGCISKHSKNYRYRLLIWMEIHVVHRLNEIDTIKGVVVDHDHVIVLVHDVDVHVLDQDHHDQDDEHLAIVIVIKTKNVNEKKIVNMNVNDVAKDCQLLKKNI